MRIQNVTLTMAWPTRSPALRKMIVGGRIPAAEMGTHTFTLA
jgi:hypothetical protein